MRSLWQRVQWRVAVLSTGALLLLSGCDDELRTTIEDGVITSSSNLLTAFLGALITVWQEGQA